MKGGQVSIFVIIAVLILAVIIAYIIVSQKNRAPEKIHSEIQLIHSFVEGCLQTSAKEALFYIGQTEGFTINVTIEDKKVFLNLNYPLTITKGESAYHIENFNTEIPVRLGAVYDAIQESMDEQMERTDAVCISCNYKISEKYNVTFDFLDTNETTTLLVIVRNSESILNYERYAFNYAIKLDERNDV